MGDVISILDDEKLHQPASLFRQPLRVLRRAQPIEAAGDSEQRTFDLLGNPGEAEFVGAATTSASSFEWLRTTNARGAQADFPKVHRQRWSIPLGVKGAAEIGTIGAPGAIVSAIEDALAPLEIVIRDLTVTPARLRARIAKAEAKQPSKQ